ncbi:ATP-binding protein [Hoyosella altamirensis]|uniref:Serine/threonine-protein kinase RsbW n=1 Tax=Hoyosella altamirensis TaxID=616997 RepID=A0A839RPC0_9ACTN|nr:ATP-binding protein [Hoyosella altamirensis]MBB3038370.1 serine/threonine-protein kinase RsbW [Hoyosella altamirensis]
MTDGVGFDHNAEERVELRFPATLTQLSLARLVTVAVMTRADFDGDSVEDLRMAVDEACTQLIATASEDGEVHCVFVSTDEGVTVTAGVTPSGNSDLQRSGLGWHIIEALTDSAVVRSLPAGAISGGDSAGTSVIELQKRKCGVKG